MAYYAICPFFLYEKRYAIGCESRMPILFKSREEKNVFVNTHCCSWDYEKCPHAQQLYHKYDRKEQREFEKIIKQKGLDRK